MADKKVSKIDDYTEKKTAKKIKIQNLLNSQNIQQTTINKKMQKKF